MLLIIVTFCDRSQIWKCEELEIWLFNVTKKLIQKGETIFYRDDHLRHKKKKKISECILTLTYVFRKVSNLKKAPQNTIQSGTLRQGDNTFDG